ncbi:MAG TPA: tRNA (N6-isopentenyl adenosine(37)-C2)-methylthiotransferase MiaB [Acidobacteriota bacterium]|jgi:tRNA-2-methylthio-N6-dimethylallyladenosine synthase|nr:tRNA (N6-isopentenyl adenosine(37)-C2)-methylthiotransferase MiaB [Acidobacteriota bacterium]
MRTFYIETFGCQMNEHDSEKVAGLLARRGFQKASSPDLADVFLINTCSIREKAEQKVYSRLGAYRSHKKTNPEFILGVLGCVAQQEGTEFIRKAPFIDLVVGTHRYHEIPHLLEQILADRRPIVRTEPMDDPQPVEIDAVLRENSYRANVTIMEGCNNFCTFCVVPYTRGPERYRASHRILDEVRRLASAGYVEVLLLGQNINSYKDPSPGKLSFSELLKEVAEVPGIRRVRFTTNHPKDFTQDILEVMEANETLCNWIHLPAQSGSSRVLRRMKRLYNRDRYLEIINSIKALKRKMALSTDIIVGFPGETEEDFEQTLSLVDEVQYDSIFSFRYSPRPKTPALKLESREAVPEPVKEARLTQLQAMQRRIQLHHNSLLLGTEQDVLVEGKARDGKKWFGRTTANKIVNFESDNVASGQFLRVTVTGFGANSLRGQPTEGMP